MQERILRFFQEIAGPELDLLAELVTMLGEEYFLIAVITFVYWNLSKKEGFKLASVFVFSAIINNVLKITFRAARPFETLDFFEGKRLETATGYSFPSGHSQGAATFFTSAARIIHRRWATVASVVIFVAVGISRVYLGVHWPVDAAAGIVLGIAAAFFFCALTDHLYDRPVLFRRVLIGIGAGVASVAGLLLILDAAVPQGSVKLADFFKASGICLGVTGGFLLERTRGGFDPRAGSPFRKAVRYAVGLTGALLLLAGLKRVFPPVILSDYVRYALAGFWAIYLWPRLGLRAGLFSR